MRFFVVFSGKCEKSAILAIPQSFLKIFSRFFQLQDAVILLDLVCNHGCPFLHYAKQFMGSFLAFVVKGVLRMKV